MDHACTPHTLDASELIRRKPNKRCRNGQSVSIGRRLNQRVHKLQVFLQDQYFAAKIADS